MKGVEKRMSWNRKEQDIYLRGIKDGSTRELEKFEKFYDRAWTFEYVKNYLKKRLKDLET